VTKEKLQERQEALRDIDWQTLSLGCQNCVERSVCGGIRSAAGSLNGCRDFCDCADPQQCRWVCPKSPIKYYLRKNETNGFDFDDVPFAKPVAITKLPDFASVVYARKLGEEILDLPIAALPFSAAFANVNRRAIAYTTEEIAARCNVRARKWILSGVEQDRRVERWWKMDNHREALEAARRTGVILATTPNFSSIIDVPRPDNLHALKRILICWEEIQNAGIAGAVHLNGRTDYDMQRMAAFIRIHKEIDFVACEFLTGAAKSDCAQSYLDRIKRLVTKVDRPLKLVTRGGFAYLSTLESLFSQVIFLDAAAFTKTHKRKSATVLPSGKIKWSHYGTAPGAPLVDLLRHNLSRTAAAQAIRRSGGQLFQVNPERSLARPKTDPRTDNEALQAGLLI
jgi:hypothetical protein